MHGVEVSPGYREGDDVRADILLATRMPHEATELHWLGRGQATKGVLLIFLKQLTRCLKCRNEFFSTSINSRTCHELGLAARR